MHLTQCLRASVAGDNSDGPDGKQHAINATRVLPYIIVVLSNFIVMY